jgi:hypothetical protein
VARGRAQPWYVEVRREWIASKVDEQVLQESLAGRMVDEPRLDLAKDFREPVHRQLVLRNPRIERSEGGFHELAREIAHRERGRPR